MTVNTGLFHSCDRWKLGGSGSNHCFLDEYTEAQNKFKELQKS